MLLTRLSLTTQLLFERVPTFRLAITSISNVIFFAIAVVVVVFIDGVLSGIRIIESVVFRFTCGVDVTVVAKAFVCKG